MLHARLSLAALVLIASLGFGGPAQADTLDVPDEFATIQEAIDFAADGDEVVIAPGEYFENINFLGKAITVRSTDPTNPGTILATIINGGGLDTVVTCDSGEGADTVLSGLLITNGFAEFDGGGMFNDNGSSPTVSNCAFSLNSAEQSGGGMFNNNGSSPTVTNSTFSENIANEIGGGGGGMANANSSPTVTNCTFSGNTADVVFGTGGGMSNLDSSPTVTNCTFSGNSAWSGGGITNRGRSIPTVTHCTFSGNFAYAGGGMLNVNTFATLTGSVFCRNTPDQLNGDYNNGGGNAFSDDHCVPLPPAEPESDCETADLNGDGLVDPLDSGFVLARFGCEG